jgi:hypothetical protein
MANNSGPTSLQAAKAEVHEQSISPTTSVKSASKRFSTELGLVGTFFLVFVTISNVAHRLFGFKLLPVVELSFNAFHEFCHWVLQLLVYSWLAPSLEWLWYSVLWLPSRFLSVIPWRPHIVIPGIVSDLALLSLAFTRVFQSADLIVPRQQRAQAETEMSSDLWKDIERIEGPFWGSIHKFLDRLNAKIWASIDAVGRVLSYPLGRNARSVAVIRRILIALAGAVLFWGFVRLAGYVINISLAGRLSSPIMVVRRRFMKYFLLNLLGAILATALFILLNGWIADWARG